MSAESSEYIFPLKAPFFWLRGCIREKKRAPETVRRQDKRKEKREATGSVLASRDVPCVGVEVGGDGVGGRAEQTKMPWGWLNNAGFDE